MDKIAPCLWFNGNAEEAARYYTSLFPGSEITSIAYYGDDMPLPAGTVLLVEFTLFGRRFQALNATPDIPFNQAISMSVSCKDQAEVDRLWKSLGDGGQPGPCGWLQDRFGVSWQVVPEALAKLVNSTDKVAVGRMFQALGTMGKLDLAALERAYRGDRA